MLKFRYPTRTGVSTWSGLKSRWIAGLENVTLAWQWMEKKQEKTARKIRNGFVWMDNRTHTQREMINVKRCLKQQNRENRRKAWSLMSWRRLASERRRNLLAFTLDQVSVNVFLVIARGSKSEGNISRKERITKMEDNKRTGERNRRKLKRFSCVIVHDSFESR